MKKMIISLYTSVSSFIYPCDRERDKYFFYFVTLQFVDKEGDKKSQKILQELENIDDECEEKDIDFVKISDEGIEKEYDLPGLPALAFYRHKFRQVYNGDMMHEEAILDWILELRTQTPDVIESVDRKTLQVLINDVEHLAVFFCKYIFASSTFLLLQKATVI